MARAAADTRAAEGVAAQRARLDAHAEGLAARDYHWTAALVFRMIQELDAGDY